MGMLAENLKKWAADFREEGRAQGLEKGKRDLLFQLVEWKYGPVVRRQLTETLLRLTTTETLDRFGNWIIQCETAEELLERIRSSANGITG